MPVYVCPKCGWRVEKPQGFYYHKKCGEDATMVTEEEYLEKKRDFAGRLLDVRTSLTIIIEDLRMENPALFKKVETFLERARDELLKTEELIKQ